MKHSVNYHADFIPSPEDNVFTSLLGLELVRRYMLVLKFCMEFYIYFFGIILVYVNNY